MSSSDNFFQLEPKFLGINSIQIFVAIIFINIYSFLLNSFKPMIRTVDMYRSYFSKFLVSLIAAGISLNGNVFAEAFHKAEDDLGQLFRHYGSDKDINGYTSVYHTLFNHLKSEPVKMLEIGIGTMIPGVHSSMVGYARPGYKPGGSLRAWRDYFVNGSIYGLDVQEDTQFYDEPRIETYLCNSLSKSDVEALMGCLNEMKFDIIIDDGSHYDLDQLTTLSHFYPYLRDGGIYIIEDIYPGSSLNTTPAVLSSFCQNDPYFFVGVNNNICVIFKKHLKRNAKSYQY